MISLKLHFLMKASKEVHGGDVGGGGEVCLR